MMEKKFILVFHGMMCRRYLSDICTSIKNENCVRIKDYKNNHKLINVLVFLLHVLVNNMCECLCVALYIPQSIFA